MFEFLFFWKSFGYKDECCCFLFFFKVEGNGGATDIPETVCKHLLVFAMIKVNRRHLLAGLDVISATEKTRRKRKERRRRSRRRLTYTRFALVSVIVDVLTCG